MVGEAPFLESYVAPICRYSEEGGNAIVKQLIGTSFLIFPHGVFLTARHVLLDAFASAEANGDQVAAFPMVLREGKAVSVAARILSFEHAEAPFDISVFTTNYESPTFLALRDQGYEVWQDVATMGYPASIVEEGQNEFRIQQRVHKGYVQRVIPRGRLGDGRHPDCFELSFPITSGLSGSPLFVHEAKSDILLGVCIGSHESRVVVYENVDVQDGSKELRERTAKVEEFGIAHDIRPLLSWRPDCLEGRSLLEESNRHRAE